MPFHNDAIFWVETDKITPNPYQPRREFDEGKLQALADSIRQYGVLQPLVVTRQETYQPDGSMVVVYELIAGERRLRASHRAGLTHVPVVIRNDEEEESVKLELAVIENLQREDLNPIDRAKAFEKLVNEFGYKHTEVAQKVGRSREYVSNSLRLLQLSPDMLEAIAARRITEGHARPLLMLADHPDEQATLFKEILMKKLTVRDAESISRHIARERVRKGAIPHNPEHTVLEDEVSERLGTRVRISPRAVGGRIVIDFDSEDSLHTIMDLLKKEYRERAANAIMQARSSTPNFAQIPNTTDIRELFTGMSQEDEAHEEESDSFDISSFSI